MALQNRQLIETQPLLLSCTFSTSYGSPIVFNEQNQTLNLALRSFKWLRATKLAIVGQERVKKYEAQKRNKNSPFVNLNPPLKPDKPMISFFDRVLGVSFDTKASKVQAVRLEPKSLERKLWKGVFFFVPR